VDVLEIFCVSWRYLIIVIEIVDRCPGDIWSVSSRYLMSILDIFDGCPVDI